MTPVDLFSLDPLPEKHPDREYSRYLAIDGLATKQPVTGIRISQQFSCGNDYLIITDYDYFDGVHTWFHLVDRHGALKDTVSTPDDFSFLQDLEMLKSNAIRFGFYGTDKHWELTIEPDAYWSFSLPDLQRRDVKFWLRRRYLRLEPSNVPRSSPLD